MALKWLLTQGVDGPDSVAANGGRDDDKNDEGEGEGDGEGGAVGGGKGGSGAGGRGEEAMAERALEYRKYGRELFTRLLASGELFLFFIFAGGGGGKLFPFVCARAQPVNSVLPAGACRRAVLFGDLAFA